MEACRWGRVGTPAGNESCGTTRKQRAQRGVAVFSLASGARLWHPGERSAGHSRSGIQLTAQYNSTRGRAAKWSWSGRRKATPLVCPRHPPSSCEAKAGVVDLPSSHGAEGGRQATRPPLRTPWPSHCVARTAECDRFCATCSVCEKTGCFVQQLGTETRTRAGTVPSARPFHGGRRIERHEHQECRLARRAGHGPARANEGRPICHCQCNRVEGGHLADRSWRARHCRAGQLPTMASEIEMAQRGKCSAVASGHRIS